MLIIKSPHCVTSVETMNRIRRMIMQTERIILKSRLRFLYFTISIEEPHGVEFQVMATGFTWNTQDRDSDTAACQAIWEHARRMLADDQLDLVLLDELTYMVAYDYLPLESVLSALRERPAHQSVIITGRGCHRDIIELADTVSELRPVKHAFDAGIKAQMGIDY